MAERHIAWSGELYHKKEEHLDDQVVPDSLWAVLMRESVLGPKRLELYRKYVDYKNHHPPKFVFDLSDMLHVERVLESSLPRAGEPPRSMLSASSPLNVYLNSSRRWNAGRPALRTSSIQPQAPRQQHHFTITTEKETRVFAARTGDESSFWVGKLNELLHGPPERGVEYEFPVKVLPTSLSRDFALHSNHLLRVTETEIQLYNASGAVPTTFVYPLENIDKVKVSKGAAGSKTISLQCTDYHGAAGTMSFLTNSSADISRIINHRRVSPAHSDRPASLYLQQHTSTQRHQRQPYNISADSAANTSPAPHTQPQCHHSTSVDSYQSKTSKHDLQMSSLVGDLRQHPPLPSTRRHHGNTNCAQNVHASIAIASPQTRGISLNNGGVAKGDNMTSLSDSQESDALMISESRKMSGSDFESLSSWFKKRDEYDSGDFNSDQCTPGTQARHTRRSFSEETKSRSRSTSLVQRNRFSRYSSVGSSIGEEDTFLGSIPSSRERGADPESLVLNESYELFDVNSWKMRPVVTNGNGIAQQAQSPAYESIEEENLESLHDYDLINEFQRQPESLPDYEDIKEGNYNLVGEAAETSPQQKQRKSLPDYEDIETSLVGRNEKLRKGGTSKERPLSDYEYIEDSLIGGNEELGEEITGERQRMSLPQDYEDVLEEEYSLAGDFLKNKTEEEREEEGEGDLEEEDEPTPDYDYVTWRILGVRGIPGQQPKPHPLTREPRDSDEEEHYYY